jgi:hypothetical protein
VDVTLSPPQNREQECRKGDSSHPSKGGRTQIGIRCRTTSESALWTPGQRSMR